MPRGDGTGPMGMGAMTGRGAGYCAGFGMPGFAIFAPGRGLGMGFGRGRRNQNRFYATGTPGRMQFGEYAAPYQMLDTRMGKQALRSRSAALQSELDSIKKRLKEIDSEKGPAA